MATNISAGYHMELLLLAVGYAAALFMAYNIGANDAANPTETAVGAGALSVRRALLLFALGVFVGAALQGRAVIKTFGKGLVPDIDLPGAIAAVVAAGIWILVASYKGLPISTTQSAVGAVLGVGLAYVALGKIKLTDIRWYVVSKVILSWILSPATAIALAFTLYILFKKLYVKLHELGYDAAKIFRAILVANLLFSAYAFGANDVGNATGVYVVVTSKYFGLPDDTTMLLLALLGSVGIILGGFSIGKRVIYTTAFRITKLDYPSAVAAELANALDVWLFTTIPYMLIGYGMPISTTHASVSAIIGVGIARARSLRGVNLKVVALIVTSWLLTLPVAALLGFTLYIALSSSIHG